jgi:hypothetical protein
MSGALSPVVPLGTQQPSGMLWRTHRWRKSEGRRSTATHRHGAALGHCCWLLASLGAHIAVSS